MTKIDEIKQSCLDFKKSQIDWVDVTSYPKDSDNIPHSFSYKRLIEITFREKEECWNIVCFDLNFKYYLVRLMTADEVASEALKRFRNKLNELLEKLV